MARDDAAVARETLLDAVDHLNREGHPQAAQELAEWTAECFRGTLADFRASTAPAPSKVRAEVVLRGKAYGYCRAEWQKDDMRGVYVRLITSSQGAWLTREELQQLAALDARADADGMVDADQETLHEVLDDLRAIDGAAWVPGALTEMAEMAEEGLGAAAPNSERQAGEVSSTPVATPRDQSDSPAPSPTPAPLGVIDGDSLPPGGLDRALREAHEASEQSAPAPNGDGRVWWMYNDGESPDTAIPVVPRFELERVQQALLVSREARHRLREAWEQEHALRVLGRADHTRADSAHARPEPMASAGANGEPTPQLTQVEDERHQLRFDLQRVQAEREEAFAHARRQHEQLAEILGRDDALPVLAARMKQGLGEAEAKLAAATRKVDRATRDRLFDAIARHNGETITETIDRVLFILERESEE